MEKVSRAGLDLILLVEWPRDSKIVSDWFKCSLGRAFKVLLIATNVTETYFWYYEMLQKKKRGQ